LFDRTVMPWRVSTKPPKHPLVPLFGHVRVATLDRSDPAILGMAELSTFFPARRIIQHP
jgi:hypothetical protein